MHGAAGRERKRGDAHIALWLAGAAVVGAGCGVRCCVLRLTACWLGVADTVDTRVPEWYSVRSGESVRIGVGVGDECGGAARAKDYHGGWPVQCGWCRDSQL